MEISDCVESRPKSSRGLEKGLVLSVTEPPVYSCEELVHGHELVE